VNPGTLKASRGDSLGKYYEDLEIGEKFTSSSRTITEADVVDFARISGDYNPLHIDSQYAQTTRFKKRIAHGALTFSVMTGLWDRLGIMRETLIAFYGVDTLRFLNPVYIGDTIHVESEVTEKQDRGKDGLITVLSTVFNQRNENVMVCTSSLLMKKKRPG
jgi:acyl dehydratase